jgi:hypothetical protein
MGIFDGNIMGVSWVMGCKNEQTLKKNVETFGCCMENWHVAMIKSIRFLIIFAG